MTAHFPGMVQTLSIKSGMLNQFIGFILECCTSFSSIMLVCNGNINFLVFLYFSNPQYRQQMSPETMKKMEKEKFYLEQKQKLKQFYTQSVDPNKLIESMFGKTEKPKVKQDTTGL